MDEVKKNELILDDFQEVAIQAVKEDSSVLVSAPTGAGKTVIAEYVIKKCLNEERSVIYTAPIKALSNQKFREFCALFPDRVGIITGDVNINPYAPLIIMTTEIFRNRILQSPESLEDYHWIIFDEIHYLDNIERGTVWEESLIFLPQHMKFVGLSATIPNINKFHSWLTTIHAHKIKVVVEETRPVPLHFMFVCYGQLISTFEKVKQLFYKKKVDYPRRNKGRIPKLVKHLHQINRLPSIYFCFSRRRCEYLSQQTSEINLLDSPEREKILRVFDELCAKYGVDEDERTRSVRKLVENGCAYHHAGIHPMLKEVLEQLFTRRLIKIIFTTETFALGINMPARTVVIDELRKNYGGFFRALKVRDFYQMAGRAGRRGIDEKGFVYSRIDPHNITWPELQRIFTTEPENIQSRFNISYATILNLYERYGEKILEVYSLSFHSYLKMSRADSASYAQLKARLRVLKQLGYIEHGALTEKGYFAKNIHGFELPISELLGSGVLEELTVDQLGILALAAVYEPRPVNKRPKFPQKAKYIRSIIKDKMRLIYRYEKRNKITELSKDFHFDLSESLLQWMQNRSFENIMQMVPFDEGEIIRYYRMSLQVLREILDADVSKSLRIHLEETIGLIKRGVIDAEAQLEKVVKLESETALQDT